MNFSEFKQRLGAEPRETAAAHRAGGEADPERERAVAEAERFEDRLEAALRLPVDETEVLDSVLAVRHRRRGPPVWLAMAASLVLIAGAAAVVWRWQQAPPETVSGYVQNHYLHDGADVLERAARASDPAAVDAVLAALGARVSDELAGQVRFIKFCPTPDSRGAHMVLSTAEGPATVIYMPAVTVTEAFLVRIEGTEARVVGLERGAAAIIGAGDDAARVLQTRLREGLRPLSADA